MAYRELMEIRAATENPPASPMPSPSTKEQIVDILCILSLEHENIDLDFQCIRAMLEWHKDDPYEAGRLHRQMELLLHTILGHLRHGIWIDRVEAEASSYLDFMEEEGAIEFDDLAQLNVRDICMPLLQLMEHFRGGGLVLERGVNETFEKYKRLMLLSLKAVVEESLPFDDDEDKLEFLNGYNDACEAQELETLNLQFEFPAPDLSVFGKKKYVEEYTVPIEKGSFPANEMCAICLVELTEDGVGGELAVRTICEHCYHGACLGTWVKSAQDNSNKCPTCRTELCERRPRRPADLDQDEDGVAATNETDSEE